MFSKGKFSPFDLSSFSGGRHDEPDIIGNIFSYKGIWLDQTGCLSNDQAEVDACREENSDWRNNDIRFVDIEGYTRFDFFTELPNDEEYPMERRASIDAVVLELEETE